MNPCYLLMKNKLTFISTTDLLGIKVSRVDYQTACSAIVRAAEQRISYLVAAVNVHSIMTGYLEPEGHGDVLNQFDLVVPDGQPIKWALNWMLEKRGKKLGDRVRGPELMLQLCQIAEIEQIPIFFYGSKPTVLTILQQELLNQFPQLKIAGAISPPFRSLTPTEEADYVQQIQNSGARIVFVSLGCPRQEGWAFRQRERLNCPMICVGAAFDFHAGNIPEAPLWMQDMGLEWFFRLLQEPKRLWQRYLLLNPLFIILLGLQLIQFYGMKMLKSDLLNKIIFPSKRWF